MIVFAKSNFSSPRLSSGPGFISYLMIVMWFLLTIIASTGARAQTAGVMQLSPADILPDIEAALTVRGMPPGAEISFNDPALTFAAPDALAFGHISYNALSGRFVIRLANSAAVIAGAARVSKNYPVLTRDIPRGDIITQNDIAYIESAAMRAGQYITDASDLIGKEARRPLRVAAPLRISDVASPVLVKKGALVTLTYALDGLRLTHQGVATGSGGKGDVISVRNIQSERMLKGVIAGENLIVIGAPRGPIEIAQG